MKPIAEYTNEELREIITGTIDLPSTPSRLTALAELEHRTAAIHTAAVQQMHPKMKPLYVLNERER